MIRLLKMGGVTAEPVDIPAEAAQSARGPRLTEDECLDFGIRSSSAIAAAAAAAAPGLHQRLDGSWPEPTLRRPVLARHGRATWAMEPWRTLTEGVVSAGAAGGSPPATLDREALASYR